MKKNISISCVITLYNREEYINGAIDCILKQTLKPLEIIVVDNSFTDIKIDEKYLDKIKIFKIIPGAGLAQALNFGASIANGEFISFLEDDDHWPENYLEEVYKEENLKLDYIVTPIKKLKNNKLTFYKNPKDKIKLNNFLIRNPGINISNLSLKKSSLFKVGGFDLDLIISVDKSIVIKFIQNNYKYTVCEKVLVIKRHHEKNLTFSKNLKIYLKNLRQFYFKYSYLMSLKIKIRFLLKYLYYKFIKKI
jgi:glycosyltransferase involved in cell wall biosynthesis